MALMVVAEFVGVLVVVAVTMWRYKIGVVAYSCLSICCSAADLLYTIWVLCSCNYSYHCLRDCDAMYPDR